MRLIVQFFFTIIGLSAVWLLGIYYSASPSFEWRDISHSQPGMDERAFSREEIKDQPQDFSSLPDAVPVSPPSPVTPVQKKGVLLIPRVPFVSQAPRGQWSDDRFQNGCEEASLLMAIGWLRGKEFSVVEAEREIVTIADFEMKIFGYYQDTDAHDTARLMREYFGRQDQGVRVQKNIVADDIIVALEQGSLVIVPVNGRMLKNPYYTPPGPLQHMLVVTGYEHRTDEFITHDPGTRYGKDFRYARTRFESAIQEYPSGNHLPVTERRKTMIVIAPS